MTHDTAQDPAAPADFTAAMREKYRDSLGLPVRNELLNHLLPFWLSVRSETDGATAGLVDAAKAVHEDAPRSLVFVSRMLWTYAELVLAGFPEAALDAGRREFRLLERQFRDEEEGGYYNMAEPGGLVKDDSKLVYAQGFALYALAAWYRATGENRVLSLAKDLFALIEVRCRVYYNDVSGYGENYSRAFALRDENPLSTHGDPAMVSMNTILHLIEAYTGLYQAWPNPAVREALLELLHFYVRYIYNPAKKRLNVFLDIALEESSDIWSLGHDIEASWLVELAADVLVQRSVPSAEDRELLDEVRRISRELEDSVLAVALEAVELPSGRPGLLHINEIVKEETDRTRIWWVQAEALCALLNAAARRQDETYLLKAQQLWPGIEELFSDKEPGGEWFDQLDPQNRPTVRPFADPWKAFYHNGRACLNTLRFFGLAKGAFPLTKS